MIFLLLHSSTQQNWIKVDFKNGLVMRTRTCDPFTYEIFILHLCHPLVLFFYNDIFLIKMYFDAISERKNN